MNFTKSTGIDETDMLQLQVFPRGERMVVHHNGGLRSSSGTIYILRYSATTKAVLGPCSYQIKVLLSGCVSLWSPQCINLRFSGSNNGARLVLHSLKMMRNV